MTNDKLEDQIDAEQEDVVLDEEDVVADQTATEVASTSGEAVDIQPQKTNEEMQAEIDELRGMLEATADRSRLLKYQTRTRGKAPTRVRLSEYEGGYIVGWRTIKDKLVKHPTTGRVVGEEQEYELLVLMPDDSVKKINIDGYPALSDARYTNRVEVEVVSRSEDWEGNSTYKVSLPDGREYDLPAQFIN